MPEVITTKLTDSELGKLKILVALRIDSLDMDIKRMSFTATGLFHHAPFLKMEMEQYKSILQKLNDPYLKTVIDV